MVIQALDEEFEVVYVQEMVQGYQIIQCHTDGGNEHYIMIHFIKENQVKKLLPLFFALGENTVYEDYKGCFTKGSSLYVVFYKRQGIPLTDLLNKDLLTLEQRILIGRHILEKVLLWKLPDFLIHQMLLTEYILIEGEDVRFHYEWYVFYEEQPGMTAVNKRTAILLRNLFSEEMERQMSLKLAELIKSLEQDVPEDFFAIYEAYSSLCDVMPKEAETYIPGIQKIRRKLAQFYYKGLEVVKIILFIVVYIMGIWLLERQGQEQEAKGQEEAGVIFERIGTLEIK